MLLSNIETLGQVLYTEYLVYFLLAGVILLVAMVGAIVSNYVNTYKFTSPTDISTSVS